MRNRLVLFLSLLLPLLWLFRRALFWQEWFAFRDSAFYYFPYYQYVKDRWSQGIPLWNPLDGLGQPLLADPTAAVLYPFKAIFWLPIEYPQCFGVYVVMHLLLGGLGTYCLARKLRAVRGGAILAGVAYELSGQVLFQYCNPIYLVGAAWLPLGLLCFCGIVQGHRLLPRLVGLSVVLSMMILGGDPQMAVHCVLCALGICSLPMLRKLRKFECQRPHATGFVALVAACLLATLLSAVQILPSQQWAARSDRAQVGENPRSLVGVGRHYLQSGELAFEGLWKRNGDWTEHEKKIYHFSVGPWRWSELFWPNIGGRFGPVHTRWLRGLAGESRMWTASLYMGLLPIALALARLRLRGCSLTVQWISWMTVISLLAGLGEYGLGWLLDELRFQSGAEFQASPVMRGFGGVYWFLTVFVPTYIDFRYPAKWWTVTTLGISLLAAKSWPLLWWKFRTRYLRRACVCGILLLIVACIGRFVLARDVPASIYGPFDEGLAWQHFSQSILHTLVMATIAWVLLKTPQRPMIQWSLIGICMVEVTLAQSWMVMTTAEPILPRTVVTNGEELKTSWRSDGHLYPASFRTTSSKNRMDEAIVHDLHSLMPKYHLLTGQRQVNSVSSLRCGDFAAALKLYRSEDIDSVNRNNWRELWGAAASSEQAWLVYDWQKLAPAQDSTPAQLARRVLLDSDLVRNHRHRAIVETQDTIPTPQPAAGVSPSSHCEITARLPEQIQLTVTAEAQALLVMSEQFYPGWTATIEERTRSGAGCHNTPGESCPARCVRSEGKIHGHIPLPTKVIPRRRMGQRDRLDCNPLVVGEEQKEDMQSGVGFQPSPSDRVMSFPLRPRGPQYNPLDLLILIVRVGMSDLCCSAFAEASKSENRRLPVRPRRHACAAWAFLELRSCPD